ncbi:MAG: hypothetical protein N3D10_01765 [Candidatus Micrarchaeota archaeon]|nr:hypothetical protein [Candidatus Micrarchaeota archaeon]
MDLEEQIIKLKKPQQNILENLEKEYSAIAKNFGFFPVQSPLFLCFKNTEGKQIAIELQFGGEKAIIESLEKLVQSNSNICFLITSSKTPGPSLSQIKNILLTKFSIGEQKYWIVDIETSRAIKVGQEGEKFFSFVSRPDWAKTQPLPPPPLFKNKKFSKKRKKDKKAGGQINGRYGNSHN